MALPTIVFNSSTGSDTAASGAGPATAVSGTAAAHTGGSASTTITLTNSPDLSGVSTTGSDALWMKTASGRQFSKITGVDNSAKTVTVEDSFNIASGSAVNYAIGGKRATWDNADSRTLFADAKPGWTIQAETDQSLTSALAVTASGDVTTGAVTITGSSRNPRPIITQTANAAVFGVNATHTKFAWLDLRNSNGTKTAADGISATQVGSLITICDCIIGHSTNQLRRCIDVGSVEIAIILDCEVKYGTSTGILGDPFSGSMRVYGCNVHHNGSGGVTSMLGLVMLNCRIWANTGDGVTILANSVNALVQLVGNTIHGNSGDGIDISVNANLHRAFIVNNNLTGNGNYGIRGRTESDLRKLLIDFNNFGTGATANTSGSLLSITAGANDLAVDPGYTDASTGDFRVGTAVKAKGFPTVGGTDLLGGGNAVASYVDIGAAQRQEPPGVGGASVLFIGAGGMG